MEDKLRKIAKDFLKRPDSECFIGYEKIEEETVKPAFIYSPEETDRLVWNDRCYMNLTTYLPQFRKAEKIVGAVVKGCDARALRELIRANQVERTKIFIVGLPCKGLKSPGEKSIAERCHGCIYPQDFKYDAVLGPMKAPGLPARGKSDMLDTLSPEKRQEFWKAELEKCIRCDACRKICYACFCPECIFESSQPRWLSGLQEQGEKFFFHSVRAFHLAGRCIGCGECQRACPAGVNLMLLNRSLQKETGELFGYKGVGVLEEKPPLIHFSKEDPDPFMGGHS